MITPAPTSVFLMDKLERVLPSDKYHKTKSKVISVATASQLCGEMGLYTSEYRSYPTEPCIARTRDFAQSDNFLNLSLYLLSMVSSKITY